MRQAFVARELSLLFRPLQGGRPQPLAVGRLCDTGHRGGGRRAGTAEELSRPGRLISPFHRSTTALPGPVVLSLLIGALPFSCSSTGFGPAKYFVVSAAVENIRDPHGVLLDHIGDDGRALERHRPETRRQVVS